MFSILGYCFLLVYTFGKIRCPSSGLLHPRDIDRFSIDQVIGLLEDLLDSAIHFDLFDDDVAVDGLGWVVRVIHHIEV